jgi:hypothetical protein
LNRFCVIRLAFIAAFAVLAVICINSIPPYTIGPPPGTGPGLSSLIGVTFSFSDLLGYSAVLLALSLLIALAPKKHQRGYLVGGRLLLDHERTR